jgi:uncharacterized protein (DUF488 family)
MIPFAAELVQIMTDADIYTLGYAGWTPGELEIALDRLDGVIVDIRFAPWSKDPVWRIDALRDRFGWRYLHVPALGNRNFRDDGPIELADPDRGLTLVEDLNRGPFRPLLICGCRDARRCHRSQVAQLLQARGHRVQEVKTLDPQTRLWPS